MRRYSPEGEYTSPEQHWRCNAGYFLLLFGNIIPQSDLKRFSGSLSMFPGGGGLWTRLRR